MTDPPYEDTDQRLGGYDTERDLDDMKAKDHPAYQYHLTNTYKFARVAEQLKKFHDDKKVKA